MASKSYNDLLNDVDNKRSKFATANQMLAANDAQRVHSRYVKDRDEAGVAVQSAEVARVLKGESGIDGLLKRFASSSGLSRKEILDMGKGYASSDYSGSSASGTTAGFDAASMCADLVIGINLYVPGTSVPGTPAKGVRVGYNIVDLLDNIYNQLKKKNRIPALPGAGALTADTDDYLKVDATGIGSSGKYDASGDKTKRSKLLTSSNVKDIRDFAKKALLPYVTAFFRAFELSDEMIHAAIDAKTDTNTKNPLNNPVLPVDTSAGIMVRMGRPELYESMKLVALGSPMIADTLDVFKYAVSRGGSQEGGKKKRSSKKRSSGRKMRGGDDQQVQEVQSMEGGKKKRSSKKRSSSKKHGGAKKRSSKKRSSAKRYGGAMEGGKKKRSSKKRSSGKRRGGAMEGGKKKKSSKKRSSGKRHGGAKRRSSKKRSSGRKH